MRGLFFIAVVGAAVAGGAQAQAPGASETSTLHLVCQGERHVIEQQTSSVSIQKDFDVTNSATGRSTTSYEAVMRGQIDVTVDGSTVKIEPTSILRNQGSLFVQVPETGWYTLENPKVDGDQITGQWRISFMQKPQVRIDRHTGGMRISGGNVDFRGTCEKAPSLSEQKF